MKLMDEKKLGFTTAVELSYIGNETFMMTYGDGVCDVNIAELVKFHKPVSYTHLDVYKRQKQT